MAVTDRLVPMVTEIIADNKRIMRSVVVSSLVSVYAPTGVSEFSVKGAFYAQFQMAVDSRHESFPVFSGG